MPTTAVLAPVCNSRYSIVLATSKRARQLIAGAEPMVNYPLNKPLSIAVEEVYKGKVNIIPDSEDVEEAEAEAALEKELEAEEEAAEETTEE